VAEEKASAPGPQPKTYEEPNDETSDTVHTEAEYPPLSDFEAAEDGPSYANVVKGKEEVKDSPPGAFCPHDRFREGLHA